MGVDLQARAQADVVRRGANQDVERSRFHTEGLSSDVVEGELRDWQGELDMRRLAGLQVDAPEGTEALDGLLGEALLLVCVELRYI